MDSRKRHLIDDDGPGAVKKHIIEGPNGAPHVNGTVAEYDADDQQERQGNDLESFRKEALYRRMKHYSREHDRAQRRIAELERSRSSSEAGIAAVSACWSQLVDTIESACGDVNDSDDQQAGVSELVDQLLENDEVPDTFTEALQEKLATTRSLVTKLAQASNRSGDVLREHAYMQSQKAQTECTVLRSQVSTLRSQLKDATSQREQYHEDLLRAESRYERQRSIGIHNSGPRTPVPPSLDVKVEVPDPAKPEPSPAASATKATTPNPSGVDDDHPLSDDGLKVVLDMRDAEISELKRQLVDERIMHTQENFRSKNILITDLLNNAYFKNLMRQVERLQVQLNQAREDAATHSQQLEDRFAQEQKLVQDNHALEQQAVTELKAQLSRRDAECVRLRERREQLEAELNERRQKDGMKFSAFSQVKTLNKSLKDRMDAFQSELRRQKAHIAARAGDAEMMKFFFENDASYVPKLKQDLMDSRRRVSALEEACSDEQRAEADLRTELATAQAELVECRAIYGDTAASPEFNKLTSELRNKEDELKRLKLELEQHTQSMNMMYDEQDKLASAWDTLESQVSDKVFELVGIEEKLLKAREEKAKADNKYFAVSRDKTTLEEEKRAVQKKIDKAEALISKMTQDKALQVEANNAANHEINTLRKFLENDRVKLDELSKNIRQLEADLATERARVLHTEDAWRQRERQLAEAQAKVNKQSLQLTKAEEKIKAKEKTLLSEAAVKVREAKVEESNVPAELEMQMKMLKCSTCNLNFRSVILSKCMHTFCKGCVDARLTTRQRRCPSCDLTFTNSEVHKFYLQ